MGGASGTVEEKSDTSSDQYAKHDSDMSGTAVAWCQKPLCQSPIELTQHGTHGAERTIEDGEQVVSNHTYSNSNVLDRALIRFLWEDIPTTNVIRYPRTSLF